MKNSFTRATSKYLFVLLFSIANLAHAQWEMQWGNSTDRQLIDCFGSGQKPPDYSKDSIGFVHQPLDEQICLISPQDKNLLLLRAELVIVVAARYAAASIERYSDKRDEMAIRVMSKINSALAALSEAHNRLQLSANSSDAFGQKVDRSYLDVYRADLLMRIAELIAVATEPTRSEIRGLFTASLDLAFAKKTFGLLKNVAIDELYSNAYRDSFIRQVQGIGFDAMVSLADFQTIATLLREPRGGCQRLEAMANDPSAACKIPTFLLDTPRLSQPKK